MSSRSNRRKRETQGPSTAQNCRKNGNSASLGMTKMSFRKERDKGGYPISHTSVRDPPQTFFRSAVIAAECQRGAIFYGSAAVVALSLE